MTHALSEQDWTIRAFVYEFFVANARPPTIIETAQHFGIPQEDALASYHRLHDAHHLYLEPGTDTIRMANPLSAVVTDYRVQVNGNWLYANCAWDTLGIPAMCHTDALIEATLPVSRKTVSYHIHDGELHAEEGLLIHIELPVRQWYENIVHT